MNVRKDDIISYRHMCTLEDVETLQRGMNFRLNPEHSVLLMSQRKNAPYRDRVTTDGLTIEYEGHDVPSSGQVTDPKSVDQALTSVNGSKTQNGRFVEAVEAYRATGKPEPVRVYEKLFAGVWSFKGVFDLIDYRCESDGVRMVFLFVLRLREDAGTPTRSHQPERTRVIPTDVKRLVWQRDGGKCVKCGATDDLHFDHDIPYSKGGTSITPDNVRILCARHNLEKSDKIE